jgi:hypothetical protein
LDDGRGGLTRDVSATEPTPRGDRQPVAGRDGERGMGGRRREAPRAPGPAVPSPGDLDALEVAVRRYSDKAGLAGIGSGPLRLVLVNQVHRVLATASCPHTTSRLVGQIAAEDALAGIGPRDAAEGMLAAQMVAVHEAALECLRRAMLDGQSFEGRQANLGQASKLVRSYAVLLEALDRHRGKGQPQVVRVERVTVEAGGRAIVGAVSQGGGEDGESGRQPHAKAIGHAPELPLRCADAVREPVPVAGGGGKGAV